MFKTFGEYMYTLLFSPLRRGRQSLNQFYIFFKVMGRSFDQCKEALLQVREEASVLTCSDAMLPVHGADRDMLRLQGETVDNYRRRLEGSNLRDGWAEQRHPLSGPGIRI